MRVLVYVGHSLCEGCALTNGDEVAHHTQCYNPLVTEVVFVEPFSVFLT